MSLQGTKRSFALTRASPKKRWVRVALTRQVQKSERSLNAHFEQPLTVADPTYTDRN